MSTHNMIRPSALSLQGKPFNRLGGDTKLLDQVDDSLQDQILLWHRKPDCECLCNKAPDIAVDRISVPRPDMPLEDLQGVLW